MKYSPQMILDASVDLFDVEGVGVSTAKVARAAGVSNGTLFNHFATKQQLLDALYLSLKSDLGSTLSEVATTGPLIEQGLNVWNAWIGWAKAKPAQHRVSILLHESGLASQDAVDASNEAFVRPLQIFEELDQLGELVDLPRNYIGAVVSQHIALAIAANLNKKHQQTAFDAMWKSITQASEQAGASK